MFNHGRLLCTLCKGGGEIGLADSRNFLSLSNLKLTHWVLIFVYHFCSQTKMMTLYDFLSLLGPSHSEQSHVTTCRRQRRRKLQLGRRRRRTSWQQLERHPTAATAAAAVVHAQYSPMGRKWQQQQERHA